MIVDLFGSKVDLFGLKVDLLGSKIVLIGSKIDLFGSTVDLFGSKIDLFGSKPTILSRNLHLPVTLMLRITVYDYFVKLILTSDHYCKTLLVLVCLCFKAVWFLQFGILVIYRNILLSSQILGEKIRLP